MLFSVGCIDFDRLLNELGGSFVSLTVTYRDDPGPSGFRADRLKLLDALRWRTGARRLIWKVEFQRRGVVHLHLLVWVPFGGDDQDQLRELRMWLWDAWERITGGYVGGRHRVDARFTGAADMARYLSADWSRDSKAYQYRVPKSWHGTGRWWAVVGLPASWEVVPVSQQTFPRLVRTLRRHRQANARYKVRCGFTRSAPTTWVLGDRSGSMQRSVMRYLALVASEGGG